MVTDPLREQHDVSIEPAGHEDNPADQSKDNGDENERLEGDGSVGDLVEDITGKEPDQGESFNDLINGANKPEEKEGGNEHH